MGSGIELDDGVLSIYQSGGANTGISLNREQAERLRSLIEKNINSKFTTYIREVGLDSANVFAIFGGRRKLTIATLERLLSKCPLVAECRIEFLVQTCGVIVSDVPYASQGVQLFLGEMEE